MSDRFDRLDSGWIAAHPAPVHGRGTTKNSRGRVLAIGASRGVPGALRLTGEAALRVGAGKLQLAVPAAIALPLGLLVPEAGVLPLAEDTSGEIAADAVGDALDHAFGACDAVVVGPGIGAKQAAAEVLRMVAAAIGSDAALVVDALAIGGLVDGADAVARCRDRLVLTPHHGEMAMLTGDDEDAIAADPAPVAQAVADRYGAVVVLKGSESWIAAPGRRPLRYGGGGTGLATGGSGDVLAGAVAGLLARGADPSTAAAWGVWLHGQGARRLATTRGPIGFLAREVPGEFPRLLPQ